MHNILLTITEALALTGLIPCIFVMLYLSAPLKQLQHNLLPITYFFSLSGNFAYYLFASSAENTIILHLISESSPALSYLLLLQFGRNHAPSWPHFLLLPGSLIGALPFLYAYEHYPTLCLEDDVCINSEQILMLYRAALFGFLFMLLMITLGRYRTDGDGISGKDKNAKYWLIVSIIFVNILLLGLNLLRAAELITQQSYDFSQIMLHIGFIYLVISSIFRVFTKTFAVQPLPYPIHLEKEKALISTLTRLLNEEKIFKNPECNRAHIAQALGINENYTSQLINHHYKQSITELLNNYRIKEAKQLLEQSTNNITDIAFDAGFKSLPSFNRIFKEATSLSPRDYRKSLP